MVSYLLGRKLYALLMIKQLQDLLVNQVRQPSYNFIPQGFPEVAKVRFAFKCIEADTNSFNVPDPLGQ